MHILLYIPFLKKEVKDGEPPIWAKRMNLPEVTRSYDSYMKKQVLEDFAHSTLQLCDAPIDVEYMEKLPASSYGFPCGFRKDFLAERAKIPESLFDLKYMEGEKEALGIKDALMDVSQIAATACGMCDIDTRPVSGVFVILYNRRANSLNFKRIKKINTYSQKLFV